LQQALGELTALPDLLAGFTGRLRKGKGKRESERDEERGRGKGVGIDALGINHHLNPLTSLFIAMVIHIRTWIYFKGLPVNVLWPIHPSLSVMALPPVALNVLLVIVLQTSINGMKMPSPLSRMDDS